MHIAGKGTKMNAYFVSFGNRPHARAMVDSLKKNFDGKVIQITDMDTKKIDNTDDVIRNEKVMGRVNFLMESLINIEDREFLIVEDDCIIADKFNDYLSGDYDIAIVKRTKPKIDKDGNDWAKEYPYSGGFVFVRNNKFYKDCYEKFQKYPDDLKDWWGDMKAIKEVINDGNYKIKELPQEKFLRVPTRPNQVNNDAVVWHHSGNIRKSWMTLQEDTISQ